MSATLKVVCVIPARLGATRFPGKMLKNLLDKPLLAWVWEAANRVPEFAEVAFAVDAPELADLVTSFGGRYIMTSPACKSGTDRLVEIHRSGVVTGDIWVNWQGDEPFITPGMIRQLLQTCGKDTADMWTLKKKVTDLREVTGVNFAKVVCDAAGNALYFSRSPIPCYRDVEVGRLDLARQVYYKHVGLYAFSDRALKLIAGMGGSELEDAEKLEQLRFLQHGLKIKVHETEQAVIGIDTPYDLQRAEAYAKTILSCKQA